VFTLKTLVTWLLQRQDGQPRPAVRPVVERRRGAAAAARDRERRVPGALAAPSSVRGRPSARRRAAQAAAQPGCAAPQDDRFRLEKRTYDSQYAPIYFCRLEIMTPLLLARVAQQWPGVPVSKILDLPEGQEVAVIGTVYKEMKLKPSILDEYNKARPRPRLGLRSAALPLPSPPQCITSDATEGCLRTCLLLTLRGRRRPHIHLSTTRRVAVHRRLVALLQCMT